MINFKENKDFCIDLRIPTARALKASRDQWPQPAGSYDGPVRVYPAAEVIEQQWLDQLASCGLRASTAIIFFKKAGYEPPVAHTDVARVGGRNWIVPCAMNWTIGGQNSTMRWYRSLVPDPDTAFEERTGLPLKTHPLSELVELHRTEIPNDTLVLVRTDIPHRACSSQDGPRWCISLRFEEGTHESWADASEKISRLLNLS